MNSIPQRDSSPDAFRLAAKLETYEAHLQAAADGRDPATWRCATQELKEMVAMSHALPQFAVGIVDIARQHLHLLGSVASSQGASPADELHQLRITIDRLREQCLGLVRQ
jgi:hypothetical protein